jgi:hypothetical protein
MDGWRWWTDGFLYECLSWWLIFVCAKMSAQNHTSQIERIYELIHAIYMQGKS